MSSEDPTEDPFVLFQKSFGDIFPGTDLSGMGKPEVSQPGSDPARQIAMAIASEGSSEPNVDPIVRMEYESLVRVAELQVADRTGLTVARSGKLSVRPVNRTVWASSSVDAYRPYLSKMAQLPTDLVDNYEGLDLGIDTGDPHSEQTLNWLSGLMAAMAPMMAGMTTGTMVGRLALRSLGTYDLPIPRPTGGPDADTLLIVAPNIEEFGTNWSLPPEDLRLWICLHEVAHHAVLGVPHIRDTISNLLVQHAGAFRNDPSELGGRLGLDFEGLDLGGEGLDSLAGSDALARLQGALDPEAVLGAVRSSEQEELLPLLEALVAVIVGVVDHVMDVVGNGLIRSYDQVTEAVRRRRVTTTDADRFVERILGLNLTQEQVDRGAAFVVGVVERAGEKGLSLLWEGAQCLPTPSEVDAPGLWLARLELLDPPTN
ncbi:MAG: zinc-dependent metalloprotease [Acidimicrobiales bacterium]|nr:zinc-dependent metalloprotease [Acidimicrobiales bacterium]